MANIGNFTKVNDGAFEGEVVTLQHTFRCRLEPVADRTEKGPAFRIIAGRADIGAGWERAARDTGVIYISAKLDDPSFPQPIYANLVQQDGDDYALVWSRPTNRG
jgi:uncharacterized protein (DUF736 family)